jgi:hypothetical protein
MLTNILYTYISNLKKIKTHSFTAQKKERVERKKERKKERE